MNQVIQSLLKGIVIHLMIRNVSMFLILMNILSIVVMFLINVQLVKYMIMQGVIIGIILLHLLFQKKRLIDMIMICVVNVLVNGLKD